MPTEEFYTLRRQIISRNFSGLNSMQKKAVLSTEGPLLVLAGAGSGKTTVLVNRVANIIKYGCAYYSEECAWEPNEMEMELMRTAALNPAMDVFDIEPLLSVRPASPWQVLAITFTNKAAGELKDRLIRVVGEQANDIWASTFHSMCVRILRRYGERLGYSRNFTIYDTDDSKRVIKDCLKNLGFSDKIFTPKSVLNEISRAKDSLILPDEFINSNYTDIRLRNIGETYAAYQKRLLSSDAMDFDDLIVNTVRLLESDSEVREHYQNQFRYVLVDEYQDTSLIQYRLVALLAGGYNNLCVVGDDDQSIYRFRGATIENILNFEQQFPNAAVIRLEQNYRSTQNILDAANAVIANNQYRKGKNLWTDNGRGEKILYKTTQGDREEGDFVANTVLEGIRNGGHASDYAILYRMNSQSNVIEQSFVRRSIPYRVVGGHKFYDRKEIKDAIAYLSVVANPDDSVRLQRIVNEPKRGIGDASITTALGASEALGISLFEVMRQSEDIPLLSRSSKKMCAFVEMIDHFREKAEELPMNELFALIMNETGYISSLDLDKETAEERKANLAELGNNLLRFREEKEDADLNDFLQEIALMTDIDSYNSAADAVVMMTVHAAKGLEFPTVFIVGMEESIFPSEMSIDLVEDIEEERRLAYVAITRAKERLYITRAQFHMLYGQTRFNQPSRFVNEIPSQLMEISDDTVRKTVEKPHGFGFATKTTFGKPSENRPANYHAAPAAKISRPEPAVIDYVVGDTVRHKAFGEGVVLSIKPMGNDSLVEVAFDKVGTKKIMSNYAKLEKV